MCVRIQSGISARAWCTIAVRITLTTAPLPALAQIPIDYPIVAVSLPQECSEAPAICEMPYSFDTPGTYDFWICPIFSPYYVTAVRFGVTWPQDWVLLQSDLCYGTVIDGGIYGPGDGVTLGLPPEPPQLAPAIRLRINAATSGRLSLIEDPATGQFAYRGEDNIWRPFFAPGGPSGAFYIRIGPLAVCEPALAPLRCSYCEWWSGRREPGWVEIPPQLELPAGAVFADTLQGWSYECYVSPNCPSPHPPGEPCFDWVSSDAEWLIFTTLEGSIGPLVIEMTVDTRALGPGSYSAIARAGSGCGNCGEVCRQLGLTIIPLSIDDSSWGALKATYH